jgi:quinol monooxygenase YgiN
MAAAPFIFIGTHAIKPGKLERFKEVAAQLAEGVDTHEPQMILFNFYLNEDETEATIVQVHPNADSMVVHMQTMREFIKIGTDELLDSKQIQIFGEPNDAVLGMVKMLSQEEAELSFKPKIGPGVSRLQL